MKSYLSEIVKAVALQCGPESSPHDIEMIHGVLNLDIIYDIIPPEILLPEIPNWYLNFISSDREVVPNEDAYEDPPLSNQFET